jgi:peptide deformylase
VAPYEIRVYGDPVLKTPAAEVTEIDGRLAALAKDMIATMYEAPGVGLAAPQVGIDRRFFVFDSGDRSGALANPEIIWMSDETQTGEEGCLSIPGVTLDVVRAMHVRVRARNVDGTEQIVEGSGLEARIFQHEIDHLDGILFVDRLSPELRKIAMKIIRGTDFEAQPPSPAAL